MQSSTGGYTRGSVLMGGRVGTGSPLEQRQGTQVTPSKGRGLRSQCLQPRDQRPLSNTEARTVAAQGYLGFDVLLKPPKSKHNWMSRGEKQGTYCFINKGCFGNLSIRNLGHNSHTGIHLRMPMTSASFPASDPSQPTPAMCPHLFSLPSITFSCDYRRA